MFKGDFTDMCTEKFRRCRWGAERRLNNVQTLADLQTIFSFSNFCGKVILKVIKLEVFDMIASLYMVQYLTLVFNDLQTQLPLKLDSDVAFK